MYLPFPENQLNFYPVQKIAHPTTARDADETLASGAAPLLPTYPPPPPPVGAAAVGPLRPTNDWRRMAPSGGGVGCRGALRGGHQVAVRRCPRARSRCGGCEWSSSGWLRVGRPPAISGRIYCWVAGVRRGSQRRPGVAASALDCPVVGWVVVELLTMAAVCPDLFLLALGDCTGRRRGRGGSGGGSRSTAGCRASSAWTARAMEVVLTKSLCSGKLDLGPRRDPGFRSG